MKQNEEMIEFSVVMPCLNEAQTLAVCINKALNFFREQAIRGEVVIADNGSTDGSLAIAEGLGVTVVRVAEKGYGSALIGGIKAARGRYVIMGDADNSYDFSALEGFIEPLRQGDDMVMGNRFRGGIKPGAMPFLHRYLGNPVLSFLGRLFFHSSIGDFHCGLRGFNRQAVLDLNLRTTGMEFASEMIVKASINHLKMSEVPIILHPDQRGRPPHLRTWRDGWRHLRFLLMYCPRWLFLYPGLAFLLFGFLGMALVLPGPLKLGGLIFDIHTLLLSATAMILGVQFIFSALLTTQFALSQGLLVTVPNYMRWFNAKSIENILVVSLLAVVAGASGIVNSVIDWQATDFGNLDATRMMRLLVPSVMLLIAGFQTGILAFFKGIIDLPLKK